MVIDVLGGRERKGEGRVGIEGVRDRRVSIARRG